MTGRDSAILLGGNGLERRVSQNVYDEEPELVRRLEPASPAVIWGVLMLAALAGAGATLWRGGESSRSDERLVATASEDRTLRRDIARLSAERDELAGRLASLERGVGEMKLSMRDSASDITGSITRQQPAAPVAHVPPVGASNAFALSLGADASIEAVRRRWSALSARYPQVLAKLTPRAQPSDVPGVFDLVAGPFVSRQEADRSCGALAELGFACDTTSYTGEPLGRP